MIRRLYLALAALVFTGSLHAAGGVNWTVDYSAALQQAKKEKKPVFLFFTGEAWCPPCQIFAKNVAAKSAFIDYANKNLINVMLDQPPYTRDSVPSPGVIQQNVALFSRYQCDGVPTMIILSPNGKELARTTGVQNAMTPEAFIQWIQSALKH